MCFLILNSGLYGDNAIITVGMLSDPLKPRHAFVSFMVSLGYVRREARRIKHVIEHLSVIREQ